MRTRGHVLLALGFLLVTIIGLTWLVEKAGLVHPPLQPVPFRPDSRSASAFFPEPVRAELISAVLAILPDEWSIQRTEVECIPTDWRSFDDRAGFLIQAEKGNDWLRVWFLPADWIGIRMVENRRCKSCYWDGVLKTDQHTIITHASQEQYHHLCERLLNARTSSLVNGGRWSAEKLFGYHTLRTDRIAAELVKRHCRTAVELGEAANSLIVLGVPARTVMLRAIREVRPREMTYGLAMDGVYAVLGEMGDPESVGVLCDRLRQNPTRYIVYALAGARHPQVGPALQEALRKASGVEDIAAIARELGLQRFSTAGPDLLATFERGTDLYYASAVANSLAALRYREAIPSIEKACAKLLPDEGWDFPNGGLRVALLRLTGDWGIPGTATRIHITGPAHVRAGESIPLRIFVEVIGTESMRTRHHIEFGLKVNGKDMIKREGGFAVFGGGLSSEYRPGDVMTLSYDVGPYLRSPGRYSVQYGDGKEPISSNAVTIEVLP